MSNSSCCDNSIDHENNDRLLNEWRTTDGTSQDHNMSMVWHQRTPIARSVMDELPNDTDEGIANQCQLNCHAMFYSGTDFPILETHPRIDESVSNHEQILNNRIRHVSNAVQIDHQNLLFQPNILRLNPISNNILSNIQDTQAHTMILPVIHVSDEHFNINHENSHRNEDATTYIGPNDFALETISQIVNDDWIMVDENMTMATGID